MLNQNRKRTIVLLLSKKINKKPYKNSPAQLRRAVFCFVLCCSTRQPLGAKRGSRAMSASTSSSWVAQLVAKRITVWFAS